MSSTFTETTSAPKVEAAKPSRRVTVPQLRGRLLRWLVLVVVLGGSIWAGIRYWSRPQSGEMQYKTSPVTRGDVTQIVSANGSLTPVQLVEVGRQISGDMTEIKDDCNPRGNGGEKIA